MKIKRVAVWWEDDEGRHQMKNWQGDYLMPSGLNEFRVRVDGRAHDEEVWLWGERGDFTKEFAGGETHVRRIRR